MRPIPSLQALRHEPQAEGSPVPAALAQAWQRLEGLVNIGCPQYSITAQHLRDPRESFVLCRCERSSLHRTQDGVRLPWRARPGKQSPSPRGDCFVAKHALSEANGNAPLVFNPPDGLAIIGFNGSILDTGVDHGGADHLMTQELLNAGDVHPTIQQTRRTGVPQAMRVQVFDTDGSADAGDVATQRPGGRSGACRADRGPGHANRRIHRRAGRCGARRRSVHASLRSAPWPPEKTSGRCPVRTSG